MMFEITYEGLMGSGIKKYVVNAENFDGAKERFLYIWRGLKESDIREVKEFIPPLPIIKEKKRQSRRVIKMYASTDIFKTFTEYLKSTWFDLRVETSNPNGFEKEYNRRLKKEIRLPDSAIQNNKWGTQIRVRFTIPSDLSLIPFEEAPAGVGGSYGRGRECWINLGKGIGEITNYYFNWELRESGLLFNFESQEEVCK